MALSKNYIVVRNDLSIFYTKGISKKMHANHCVTIIVSETSVTVSFDHQKVFSKGFILTSDTLHQVTTNESSIVSIFIDPESEIGQTIHLLFKQSKVLKLEDQTADNLFDFFNNSFDHHITELEIKKFITTMLIDIPLLDVGHAVDQRIQTVIQTIRNANNFSVSFADLLNSSTLSESRLIHLFKQEVGITIRKYIRWRRIQKALRTMSGGMSIKETAKAAGFADGAHFTRTFVSMYGIAPSMMLK